MSLLTNLAAYWKLDESSGNAADSSGGGFTLTNTNTVAYSAGLINNGADFSTSGSKYLTRASNLGITGGSCSISLWVKLNTAISGGNTPYCFAQIGDAGTNVNNNIMYIFNGGTPQVIARRQKQNIANDDVPYAITLSTSAYTHIVYTYDATTVTLYVNGVSQGTPIGSTGSGASGGGSWANLANENSGGGSFALTKMDEVGVWSRALTAGEITSLYNGGAGLQYPFSTFQPIFNKIPSQAVKRASSY